MVGPGLGDGQRQRDAVGVERGLVVAELRAHVADEVEGGPQARIARPGVLLEDGDPKFESEFVGLQSIRVA